MDWVEGKDADGNEVADKSVRVLDYACGPGMVSRVSQSLKRPCSDPKLTGISPVSGFHP